MSHADYFMMALCLWREARGEGRPGQVAVGCVVRNRTLRNHSTFYEEVVKPWQFSSITAKGDPQLSLYPLPMDAQWQQCSTLAQSIVNGEVQDVTGGATLYWNPKAIDPGKTFVTLAGQTVRFPKTWDADKVQETVQIGAHIFLRELP